VRIALGSLAELDTQLDLAVRLNLLEASEFAGASTQLARAGQLLHGLERALKRRVGQILLTGIGLMVAGAASARALWMLAA
jgi:hypothetical protein